MPERNAFQIATDASKREALKRGIDELFEVARREGVHKSLVPDVLLYEAISLISSDLRMGRHWLSNAIEKIERARDANALYADGVNKGMDALIPYNAQ